MNYTELARTNIRNMTPYSSARDEFESDADVYLDANESPFDNGVNRYPDPYQKALKQAIGELKSVESDQLILGNGSDELIDLVLRCFCTPGKDEIIITPPTYGMYKVLAGINDIFCREVLLKPDFSLDMENLILAINKDTKVIVLCSPNNPTGNLLAGQDVERLLEAFTGIVFLDEAYIDFALSASWISRLNQFPNLIICQTLSKAWGMAAIRLGIGIANPEIIKILHRIKPPYNVNKLTQDKAIELLSDTKEFGERLDFLKSEKRRVMAELKQIPVVRFVYPSDANFLLVKVNDADEVYRRLIQDGIVIRNRSSQILCENCLRISIGLREENDQLLASLKKIIT